MVPAISCVNVQKHFGEPAARQLVLRGITVDLFPNELTIIAGPSGCGKTTLLSILGGANTPSSGKVSAFGADLAAMTQSALSDFRRKDVGFIFQQYNLVPALTAAENAAVPLIIAGVKPRIAIASAKRELEQLGLAAHADKHPRALSGGQQQRVAIARALVHQPRLIICDEPTAALDSTSGEAVMGILDQISHDENRAVIVVTHDHRVFRYADRLIELEDGLILRDERIQPRDDAAALREVAARMRESSSQEKAA